MAIKRIQRYSDPDLFEYFLSDEFAVYDVETADVLDQLLKHMQGLFLIMSGGPGRHWMSVLQVAYDITDYWDESECARLKQSLIDDCHLLTAAVADMMENPIDHNRHLVFMEIRAKVRWLNLPTDEAIRNPASVATA